MKLNRFCVALALVAAVLCASTEVGLCGEGQILRMKPGGVHNCKGSQNSAQIEGLARFAVEEHNKNENALLEFARALKAKELVVAGTLYHLTLEAVDSGKKKIYEAKVWLQEFKYAEDVPASKASGLGRGIGLTTNELVWP
ncbi:hypothetical protein EUGRSUZ_A02184 [Eucalyptus grandis]|uniref:Uncharacterized protein n=2 Tax=Eucalyptus grandis TaxID=71139 RepID=A0ACC3M5P9_EUCGR|nr:hypothetical protein EUGRSUZ_A02184 [Eucalyptus grandis]